MTWNDSFLALFDRSNAKFQEGNTDPETYYTASDLALLDSIGYQKREFFDFVEDFCGEGTPSISTALLIAAVRRDYFQTVQHSVKSTGKPLTRDDIPTFGDELEGMAYLPRILAKGRAKLRGELDPDLMYGCGGDHRFLQNHGDLHPADFLRHLWAAGDDDSKIVAWIKSQIKG
ncbi:MAG: DUF5069 domain-containing protein [Verrucomicrobiaceae bacterium]|nr:MAG: DUF5069 domain-containing protein [Verrucomicrobiaceae bacterium]